MPPKQPSDACSSTNSSIAADDPHQAFYQNAIQTSNLSDITVGELLLKYQDNSHLLNHILAAKAEEDKRRTAEEWRQAEEARLQSKFIEYELNQRQEGSNGDNDINQSLDNFLMHHQQNDATMFDSSYFDQASDHPSTQFSSADLSNSLQARLDATPLPGSSISEYAFIQHQQHQEATSVASSSPSIDLLSPSAFDMYQHQQHQSMSCSPPDMDDLPLFPCSNTTTTLTTAPIIPSHTLLSNARSHGIHHSAKSPSQSPVPATVTVASSSLSSPPPSHSQQNKSKSGRSATMHRTLSYESVMSLDDLNMNKKSASSPSAPPAPPPQPLDHDKVMEALRAKLRRSSSPYQNTRRKPSPEPIPPPNTYPTTGVLLLNLKSRRRKSSVTKRGSGNSSGSGSKS